MSKAQRAVEFYGRDRSSRDDWATPPEIFGPLNDEFGFTLDVCATAATAKCGRYYTEREDGLSQPWAGVVWCNPPYGRQIGRWIERAAAAAREGATVVCLVPVRSDTRWWHENVIANNAEVRFLRGRVNFGGEREKGHNAPFPSAVVVFRPQVTRTIASTGQRYTMAEYADGSFGYEYLPE